jgi:hypothetical protein
MDVRKLYRVVEEYLGKKARMLYFNTEKKKLDVCCIIHFY